MNFEVWNKNTYSEFILYLKSIKENNYKEFSEKIVNSNYEVLGIRLPILRKIASNISKSNIEDYLKCTTNKYYEEVLIEGLVISNLKDKNKFIKYFDKYINKIDSWGICDSICNNAKLIKKDPDFFIEYIFNLLNEKNEFRVRVGLILLLSHCKKIEYLNRIFDSINNIKTHPYYVDMATAWLISDLYVKFPKETLKYIKNNNLNDFTHNKAIQKIRESLRISKDEKEMLNTLKRGIKNGKKEK